MRVGGEKINMLDRGGKSAEGLNGIQAEENPAFAEEFSNGLVIQALSTNKVSRGQGHEPGIFIYLADYIFGADLAKVAGVEQPHLDALAGESHPWINVGGIVIVVNEDVVAFPKLESGIDIAQGEGGWTDQGDFVGLTVQQFGGGLTRFVQPVHDKRFLVSKGSGENAISHGLGNALGQRADAGMGKKNFPFSDGKFVVAEGRGGEDFGQGHELKGVNKRY
jgi:hypothetical protein